MQNAFRLVNTCAGLELPGVQKEVWRQQSHWVVMLPQKTTFAQETSTYIDKKVLINLKYIYGNNTNWLLSIAKVG